MQLSPHFTLEEMVRSGSHPEIPNQPSAEIIKALTVLCQNYLEFARNAFGPLLVHSGYRSPALNKAVGGIWTSAHCYGAAADITAVDPAVDVTTLAKWFRDKSGLPFDQVIDESAGNARWCHIGMAYPLHMVPRYQSLVYRANGRPPYTVMP